MLKLFLVLTPSLPYLEPSRISSLEALASVTANVSNLFHAQPNPPHSSYKIPSLCWGLKSLAFMFHLPQPQNSGSTPPPCLTPKLKKMSLNREKGQGGRVWKEGILFAIPPPPTFIHPGGIGLYE